MIKISEWCEDCIFYDGQDECNFTECIKETDDYEI